MTSPAETNRTQNLYLQGRHEIFVRRRPRAGLLQNLQRYSVVKERLAVKNIPDSALKPFDIKQENVAPPEKVGGAAFGGLIGYMVILLCLTGGMYPAMDLTAGEKERGTMETVLSSPVSRVHLVLGKFFMVLTASLVTAALSVTSMGVSFWAVEHFHAFDRAGSDAAEFQLRIGFGSVLSVFVMVLPLAVLFSAALMTISLFAKSYKEAQSYVTPLMMVVILPAVAAMLPGVELTSKLALVPILNMSLLCKELVTGTYHWNYIAINFLLHLRVCGGGAISRRENVPARRCPLSLVNPLAGLLELLSINFRSF